MMLQLLRLFTSMILQVTISFVVLHWMSVVWRKETLININTFAASYLNSQGLNNSCLKSRQLRP